MAMVGAAVAVPVLAGSRFCFLLACSTVTVAMVAVTVPVPSVIEDENAEQIHTEAEDCNQHQSVRVDVWWIQETLEI